MPTLFVGNTAIQYVIRRSAKASRRRIVVTPERVEVVAPEEHTDDEIAEFVHRRRRWVYDEAEKMREQVMGTARPSRFVTGAKVLYRGRQMRLRVVPAQGAEVRIEYRGGFVVTAPAEIDSVRRNQRIEAAFEAWFRERVQQDAEQTVRRYTPRLGVEPAGVRVKEQKHLWGSCGRDGTINLNWQLIFAPRPVLEYAVVHELCHLRDRSHDASFWRLLREVLPDYESRKTWLERHEWTCRWR